MGRSHWVHSLDDMLFSLISITAVLLSSLVTTSCPPAAPHTSHVRPLNKRVRAALDLSYASSSTVRRLVDELEASDVIVHILTRPEGPGPQGTLRFVAAAHGARFVRVTVDTALSDRELGALIGHELHHAVEVARARWVQNQESFAALYRRVGQATDLAARHYDTAEARLVAQRVFVEMGRERRSRGASVAGPR